MNCIIYRGVIIKIERVEYDRGVVYLADVPENEKYKSYKCFKKDDLGYYKNHDLGKVFDYSRYEFIKNLFEQDPDAAWSANNVNFGKIAGIADNGAYIIGCDIEGGEKYSSSALMFKTYQRYFTTATITPIEYDQEVVEMATTYARAVVSVRDGYDNTQGKICGYDHQHLLVAVPTEGYSSNYDVFKSCVNVHFLFNVEKFRIIKTFVKNIKFVCDQ